MLRPNNQINEELILGHESSLKDHHRIDDIGPFGVGPHSVLLGSTVPLH